MDLSKLNATAVLDRIKNGALREGSVMSDPVYEVQWSDPTFRRELFAHVTAGMRPVHENILEGLPTFEPGGEKTLYENAVADLGAALLLRYENRLGRRFWESLEPRFISRSEVLAVGAVAAAVDESTSPAYHPPREILELELDLANHHVAEAFENGNPIRTDMEEDLRVARAQLAERTDLPPLADELREPLSHVRYRYALDAGLPTTPTPTF